MTIDFLDIMKDVKLTTGSNRQGLARADAPALTRANRGKKMCAMEMVAFLDGDEHTDHPTCACPVITEYVIWMNDAMNDSERSRLLPFLPRIVGTRIDLATETRRAEYLTWKALTVFSGDAALVELPPHKAARLASISTAIALLKATGDGRVRVLNAFLDVLDGVLRIGPPSPGFSQPLPAPGEAARQLGMVPV